MAVVSLLLPAVVAYALDMAPDLSSRVSRNGPNIFYTIATSSYTSATKTEVAVYYDDARAASGDTISLIKPTDPGSACSGDLKIRVTLNGAPNSSKSKDNAACTSAYGNYGTTKPELDQDTGKYIVHVTVAQVGGTKGYFRFSVRSNNGIVRAIGKGVMSYETTYSRDSQIYTNYQLKFGSDCTVPQNGAWKSVTIVDPDRDGNGGAQRPAEGKSFYILVKAAPRSDRSGKGVDLSKDEYKLINGGNARFASDSSRPGILPIAPNKQNSTFQIRMKPDMKYWLYINDMDNNNTIQIILPTDEVFHDIPCHWWYNTQSGVDVNSSDPNHWASYAGSLRGSADTVGDKLYFGHKIINEDKTRSGYTLSVAKQQFWTKTPLTTTVDTNNPSNWRPPAGTVTLDKATFPAPGSWSNAYYYMTANTVNRGNLKGSPYILTRDDVNRHTGEYLCERVAAYPVNLLSIDPQKQKWQLSTPACVKIEYNYDVNPYVSLGQTEVSVGGSVSGISGSVYNRSSRETPRKLQSAVVRYVVPRGTSTGDPQRGELKVAGSGSDFGCMIASRVYRGQIRHCTDALYHNYGGAKFANGTSTTLIVNKTDNIAPLNLQVGDRICYMTVVNQYNMDATPQDWRYSEPDCVTVSVTPFVQVWGNDTRVGSPFAGGSTAKSASVIGRAGVYGGKTSGSWGEYGVLAPTSTNGTATVNVFASGAGYGAGGNVKALTFANTGTLGNFTAPTAMGSIPNVPNYFETNKDKIGGTVTINRSLSRIGNYMPNTVIIARGAVTIEGDLTVPSSLASGYKGVSQMVIIADSINIKSTVSRVDAWLIATKGDINTCSDKPNKLTSGGGRDSCDTSLRITGPLMAAKKVLPRRTYSNASGDPAEIYNLRGDAYLWAYRVSEASGTLKTVSTKELPPRF